MPDQRDATDALNGLESPTSAEPTYHVESFADVSGRGSDTDPRDGSPPRVLADRYLLEEQIASGGMASVWRAHDEKLARTVAVKLLHRHLSEAEDFRERFRREAVSAAKLSHPGIVGVYDTGASGAVVYLVMEYVEGWTFADVIAEHAPMDPGHVALIGQQVATALHAANRLGVVHRDVKPANILIDRSGVAKVADFGIAKAEDALGDLTSTGMVLGTAAYLAPEQIRALPVDHRVDQYALGCVLYEALTGNKPFVADTSVAVAAQRLRTDPTDVRSVRGDVPRGLADTVMRALERSPDDRWPDNGAFADALGAYAVTPYSAIAPYAMTPAAGDGAPATSADFGASPAVSGEHSFLRSEGRWLSAVMALVLTAAVLVGIGLATGVIEAGGIPSLAAFEIGRDAQDGAEEPVQESLVPSADSLSVFDPAGDGENNDQLPLVVDSDPATAWETETYRNRPDFGGLKDGVGIVVDLGEARTVVGAEITTPTPGITVQLRTADDPSDGLSQWAAATEPAAIEDTALIEAEPTETRYVMLWITGDLASVGEDRWRAAIGELTVLVQPA